MRDTPAPGGGVARAFVLFPAPLFLAGAGLLALGEELGRTSRKDTLLLLGVGLTLWLVGTLGSLWFGIIASRSAQRWVLLPALCLRCGYPLSSNDLPNSPRVCPECGESHPPAGVPVRVESVAHGAAACVHLTGAVASIAVGCALVWLIMRRY